MLLKIYAITAVILFFKMDAISILQGVGRARSGVFTNPEDARVFSAKLQAAETPSVQRGHLAWRNDLENIPIFLILAGIYVLAGDLSVGAFKLYCIVFVVARILHTIFYLNSMQPWRTIAYTVGILATVALAIHLLIEVGFA